MDFKEALKKIKNNGYGFTLLVISDPKERARKLMDLLPGTSSWDQKIINELFESVEKDLLATREIMDVI